MLNPKVNHSAAKEQRERSRKEIAEFIGEHFPELSTVECFSAEEALKIHAHWAAYVDEKYMPKELCLICEEDLDQEGRCPNDCTENVGYGIIAGWHRDDPEEDI